MSWSSHCDVDTGTVVIRLMDNSDLITFRHDEEWEDGGSGEDEGATRKKEFGGLYKKQMNMRKVNHQNTHTLSLDFLTKTFFSHKFSHLSENHSAMLWLLSVHICQPAVGREEGRQAGRQGMGLWGPCQSSLW